MRKRGVLEGMVSAGLMLAVWAGPAGAADGPRVGSMAVSDAWSDRVLAAHNNPRARYGARPLQWSPALHPATTQYAGQCKFAHSDAQGRYGENLYASSNLNAGINDAVAAWMAEAAKYNYNQPGFSAATGHFTQVVWKSTTQVAAAIVHCRAGTIFPHPSVFIVVRYTPPGNYAGQFPLNVGRPMA